MKKVHLRFACPERKESLHQITNDTYHCHSCQRQVTDYSDDLNFSKIKSSSVSDGPSCGIFRASQVANTKLLSCAFGVLAIGATSCTEQAIHPENLQKEAMEAGRIAMIAEEEEGLFLGDFDVIDREDEEILITIEIPAQPKNGVEEFKNRLKEQLNKQDLDKGRIFLSLLISNTGRLKDITLLRGLSSETNTRVIETLKKLDPEFQPGTLNGVAMESGIVLPIQIQ